MSPLWLPDSSAMTKGGAVPPTGRPAMWKPWVWTLQAQAGTDGLVESRWSKAGFGRQPIVSLVSVNALSPFAGMGFAA